MPDTSVRPVLRFSDVNRITGYSRSSIYRLCKDGRFPKPVKLGPRAVGWPEEVIKKWVAEKEAQYPELCPPKLMPAQAPEPSEPEVAPQAPEPSEKTPTQAPEPRAPEAPKASAPPKKTTVFLKDAPTYEVPFWHPLYKQSGGES